MVETDVVDRLARLEAQIAAQTPPNGKPWRQRRGSEAWVALAASLTATGPALQEVLGGRPLTALEVTAMVAGVTVIASAYIICRTWLKTESRDDG